MYKQNPSIVDVKRRFKLDGHTLTCDDLDIKLNINDLLMSIDYNANTLTFSHTSNDDEVITLKPANRNSTLQRAQWQDAWATANKSARHDSFPR